MMARREVVLLAFWVLCGSQPCPKNCKVIHNLSTCNNVTGVCYEGCVAGYYGNTCNLMCDTNCQRGSCQRRDGSCNCLHGYAFTTGSCKPHLGVECTFNYHCLDNKCLSASRDDCLNGCKPGWFGKFCNQRCFSNCVCEKESGNCSSCIHGWYGTECGFRCSPGCINNNCDTFGNCVHGCLTGSHGERCELNCSQHCVSGCDQLSGDCVQCEAGRYGSTCQSECSVGCAGTNRDCDRDGQCYRGCSKGYYGQRCKLNCSRHCVSGCDQRSGDCVQCVAGRYGSACQSGCSAGCANRDCDRDGQCYRGCSKGYYGQRCELNCSRHCMSGCDQLSGDCVQCEAGRYGSTCQSECSAGCAGANKRCHRDGSCIGRCRNSYHGEKCESTCPHHCYRDLCDRNGKCSACRNGFFGTFCYGTCPRCTDGICEKISGECIKGCERGFFGSFCNKTCEACDDGCDVETGECLDKGSASSLIGRGIQYWVGGGVALVIIIIAAVLMYICYRFKRLHGEIYDAAKWRRCGQSVELDKGHGVVPRYTVSDAEMVMTPPRVCPIRHKRRTFYIRPQHSDGSGNIMQFAEVSGREGYEPQAAAALPGNITRCSDELSDSYTIPNYCEVDEDLITSLPQSVQSTPAPVSNNTSLSVVTDVPVQAEISDDKSANADNINIPLIADCFWNTETQDPQLEEESRPAEENYDHLFRDHFVP